MQATFGANAVGLAHINSAADVAADHAGGAVGYTALWRAHVQAPLPGGGAGELSERPRVPDQVSATVGATYTQHIARLALAVCHMIMILLMQ